MPTVTFSPNYFRQELHVYGSWLRALPRELVQNSQDARATRIEMTTTVLDDGGVRLVVTDDGDGMDLATLEQVFFAVGETTKHTTDTIGGFGRARVITCFAQRAYQIRTRHLHVEGHGAHYTIAESDRYVDGCEFTIDLTGDDDVDTVRSEIQWALRTSHLAAHTTLDDVRIGDRPLPTRARRILTDDDGEWAKVYLDKDRLGYLYLRVGGLTMFRRPLPGDDDIIVELEPTRSRQVLSASRDQLSSPFDERLDRYIDELTRNRNRALRPLTRPLDLHVPGGGWTLAGSPAEPDDTAGSDATADSGTNGAPGTDEGTLPPEDVQRAVAAHHAGLSGRRQPVTAHSVAASSAVGFDVFLIAAAVDSRVNRLRRAWDPSGWDPTSTSRRRKLLLAWHAAVDVACDTITTMYPTLGTFPWTVGWTFDADSEACHRRTVSGHVFAVNPVGSGTSAVFKVGASSDRQKLVALALHEVAHVIVDGHDEPFANLYTDLVAAVDWSAANRRVHAAAKSG